MHEDVRRLSFLFRAERQARPVLLLGAGCSFRSGVPMADEAVKQIARAAYARNVLGREETQCNLRPSDWLPYLHRQPWFIADQDRLAENFPLAVEHLLTPREFRREFLLKLIEPKRISPGYAALAHLVARRLCWTVLTTNFDHLVATAFRQHYPQVRDLVEVNQTNGDRVLFRVANRCQVVYVHGAVEFYGDRTRNDEIARLDSELVRLLRPLLNESPLVVVGYRGSEASVMEHLIGEGVEESGNYRHGVFWCRMRDEPLHERVQALQARIGANFSLIDIDGFDELLCDLEAQLSDETMPIGSVPLPTRAAPPTADETPLGDVSVSDLDLDVALATLGSYCAKLRMPAPTRENIVAFMVDQRMLQDDLGTLRPARGCYLLFGRDVEARVPHAAISITRGGKARSIISGNLIAQFRALGELLREPGVNPNLRLKTRLGSVEQSAYPDRALLEVMINLLVHRDYSSTDVATIDIVPGTSITFDNPGGLPDEVRRALETKNGRVIPRRSITHCRNPIIADVFYALGPMDKAGSGLADVEKLMASHGGKSEFRIDDANERFVGVLLQPRQEAPATSRVASPLSQTEVYITNLLRCVAMPRRIFWASFPSSSPVRFSEDSPPSASPIFVRRDERLYTFAVLTNHEPFCRINDIAGGSSSDTAEFCRSTTENRDIVAWLLRKHWEFFLKSFEETGLIVDGRARRACFSLVSGDRNTISYVTAQGRQVKRDVVKRRQRGSTIEHENEGIAYSVVQFDDDWAIQVKPMYQFTGSDGRTPLSGYLQSSRSTRRMKFDRNQNVEHDLKFWARFLSRGQPSFGIGGTCVGDLVVDGDYINLEVHPEVVTTC